MTKLSISKVYKWYEVHTLNALKVIVMLLKMIFVLDDLAINIKNWWKSNWPAERKLMDPIYYLAWCMRLWAWGVLLQDWCQKNWIFYKKINVLRLQMTSHNEFHRADALWPCGHIHTHIYILFTYFVRFVGFIVCCVAVELNPFAVYLLVQ